MLRWMLIAASLSLPCVAWGLRLAPLAPHAARRCTTPHMASWTEADMQAQRLPLPSAVDGLLSADTARSETEALWAALRCPVGIEPTAALRCSVSLLLRLAPLCDAC